MKLELRIPTESTGHSLFLSEASRRDLISKSRKGSKKRFNKRLNYQVSNFKGCDLKQLFERDYFVFNTPINDYQCTIAFPGVLSELRDVVKTTHGDPRKINYQMVLKALRVAFDKTDDVKVRCSCADFKYRFMYWADRNGYLYGPPDKGTEEFPDKTNPDDALGATCKHLDLFLSNKRWLIKGASVVNALIKTYPDKAAVYLYDPDEIVKPDESEEEKPELKIPEKEEPKKKDDESQEDEVPEETAEDNNEESSEESSEGNEEENNQD